MNAEIQLRGGHETAMLWSVLEQMSTAARLSETWHSGVWIALGVTLVFAAVVRLLRGVSRSGAVAGGVVCFLLYVSAGPGAFAALVSVFLLTWLTTRLGYRRKQRLGTAERSEGRSASQVLANLGVAAGCAVLHAVLGNDALLLATSAALAEAAADTVSSECGQALSKKARLITTWEQVPAGTDGGITAAGTIAGAAAALGVSLVSVLTHLLPGRWLGISVAAAVAGMVLDSYLGAWLERKNVLGNDAVNFLSTMAAGVASMLWIVVKQA